MKPRSDRKLTNDEMRVAIHLIEDGDANAVQMGSYFHVQAALFWSAMHGKTYQELSGSPPPGACGRRLSR